MPPPALVSLLDRGGLGGALLHKDFPDAAGIPIMLEGQGLLDLLRYQSGRLGSAFRPKARRPQGDLPASSLDSTGLGGAGGDSGAGTGVTRRWSCQGSGGSRWDAGGDGGAATAGADFFFFFFSPACKRVRVSIREV